MQGVYVPKSASELKGRPGCAEIFVGIPAAVRRTCIKMERLLGRIDNAEPAHAYSLEL